MRENSFESFQMVIESACQNQKPLLIFGAGKNGILIKKYLKKKGYSVKAFLDNDKNKQGKRKCKVRIMSPEMGTRKFSEGLIMISNVMHGKEMQEQLMNMGIKKENIFLCDSKIINEVQYEYYNRCYQEDDYFIYHHPIQEDETFFARLIFNKLKSVIFKIKMWFFYPKEERSFKYTVSICAIFKNEARYLREWIEYHRIVGVQHFYLYNNFSEDDFITILTPYINAGLVTLIEWPYAQSQMEAYKDCIDKYACESQWLGFIDLDEFVVPIQYDTIYDFLKTKRKRGSILIHWKCFGSAGKRDRDLSNLVIEDFNECWEKHSDVGKCFYNTRYKVLSDNVKNSVLHHFLWTEYEGKQFLPVNVFDNVCFPGMPVGGGKAFPIQINHYVTKSYSEYQNKMRGTDVYFRENPHTEQAFWFHDEKSGSIDTNIERYILKLKERIKESEITG